MLHPRHNPFASLACIALISAAFVKSALVGCRKADPPAPKENATVPDEAAATAQPREVAADPAADQPRPTRAADPAADQPRLTRAVDDLESADRARIAPSNVASTPKPQPTETATSPRSDHEPHAAVADPAPLSRIDRKSVERAEKTDDPAPGDDLEVIDGVIARGVERRVPTGAADTFEEGTVWAWVKVKNPGEASRIRMVWKREGEVRSRVELRVGTSSRWRTWSRKTMTARDAGDWTVEVTTWDGRLLDTMDFSVEPNSLADSASH